MVDASHRILGNRADAEDAANQAIAKVLADPPRETPDDWKAWLCRTAQYAAMDIRRRKKKEQELPVLVGGLLPDQFRHVELHLDTRRLLARLCEFLPDAKCEDFALLCDVEMKLITQKELAEKLGMPRQRLKSRLKRVRKAAQEAAVAVCLVDGRGSDRCDGLRWLAGIQGSPSMLKVIGKHAEECTGPCEKIWRNPPRLLGKLLAVPGLALPAGLLAKFMQATTGKKVVTAWTVTAASTSLAAAVFVGESDTAQREPYGVMPGAWTSEPHTTGLPPQPQQAPPPAEEPAPQAPPPDEPAPQSPPEPPAEDGPLPEVRVTVDGGAA